MKPKAKVTDEAIQMLNAFGYSITETVEIGSYDLCLVYHMMGFYQLAMQRHGYDWTNLDQQGTIFPNFPAGSVKPFVSTLKKWSEEYGDLYIKSHNDDRTEQYYRILKRLGFKIIQRNLMGEDLLVIEGC
jgi:hypothetical protein